MRALVVGLVIVAATAGCGEAPARTALTGDVTRVQAAVTRGSASDRAAASAALRAHLAARLVAGDVSPSRAAAILDQLSRVLADAAVPVVRPTNPAPSAPVHGKDEKGDSEGDGGGD